jgi:hypothetical protein
VCAASLIKEPCPFCFLRRRGHDGIIECDDWLVLASLGFGICVTAFNSNT